jgi:hypothetical protein
LLTVKKTVKLTAVKYTRKLIPPVRSYLPSSIWNKEYGKTLNRLHLDKVLNKIYGVFLGERAQKDGSLNVLPLSHFLKELWQF